MLDLLLVDDEPAARMAFRDLLVWEETGCRIAGMAANGREALDFLARSPADIVVTDLKMPVMDGLELIRRLTESGFPGVILVMSNYSDFDLVRQALLSGAQDYLLKVNLDRDTLLAQLDRAAHTLAEKGVRPAESAPEPARYREGALYDLLLGEPDPRTQADLARTLLDRPPYRLFAVSLHKRREHKPVPERSARSLLRSVLGTADILHLPDGGYLCLTPQPGDGEAAAARAEQILRQFHMYLNCRCGVVYSRPVETAAQLAGEYRLCGRTMQLLFYEPLPARRAAEPCTLAGLAGAPPPEQTAQRLTERFITGGLPAVTEELDRFLGRCARDAVDPQAVCGYAYALVQALILADPVRAAPLALARHAALLSCTEGQELRTILLEMLPALLENGLLTGRPDGNKDVKAVMLYIQYHYMHHITLEEIAASVNLDKSYLCRLFKKETGQSIFQYLNDRRMARAAEMIEKGNPYVREVAAAVGIEDPFYFTRLFKKKFGVAPSEYRGSPRPEEPD